MGEPESDERNMARAFFQSTASTVLVTVIVGACAAWINTWALVGRLVDRTTAMEQAVINLVADTRDIDESLHECRERYIGIETRLEFYSGGSSSGGNP